MQNRIALIQSLPFERPGFLNTAASGIRLVLQHLPYASEDEATSYNSLRIYLFSMTVT